MENEKKRRIGRFFIYKYKGFAVDLHWGSPRLVSQTVGYYRTAVGYYRVIAQKTLKWKGSHQNLFKTPKMIEIGSITAENDKNENRLKKFQQKEEDFQLT